MEIQRLVRRTAVGGFIVAGGVVLAQSAAGAEEVTTTASSTKTPVKRQILEEQAPASKTATAARTSKAAAAPTRKPAPTTRKPATTKAATTKAATTKAAATPTKAAPTTVASAPEPAPAPVEAAVTTAVATETQVAVQTAVAPERAPAPPVDGPADGGSPATELTVVTPQATTGAGSAQEVSSEEAVAAGPPPPDDSTVTTAALSATASPVLVSNAPNASTAQLTGTSPNGEITITINEPLPGTVVAPGTPVLVTGTVSVGGPSPINVIYVIDVSGSTSGSGGACGDPNGDGAADTILDCEIAGITALNNSLGNAPVDVSLVTFSSDAVAQDLNAVAGGVQATTGPTTDANANGVPDVIDVLNGLTSGGGTNFDAALDAVQALLVPGEQNLVFFLSDGQSGLDTGPGSALQAVADAGAQVLTFAVGTGTTGCAGGEPLFVIADTTGGTCTEVTDPSQLSAALTGFSLTGIDRVEIEVNGFVAEVAVSPLGFFSITVPPDILRPGVNTIIARAFGADELAGQVAEADTFVIVGSTVGGPIGGAGSDADDFLVDLDVDDDDRDVDVAGILPVTGGDPGHLAATGALSFLLGGLMLGSGRHLRRRRRLQARA